MKILTLLLNVSKKIEISCKKGRGKRQKREKDAKKRKFLT